MTGPDHPLAHARWLATAESRAVLAALAAGGCQSRFVGGCVRDTLLDPRLDPHDLDLATPEPPLRALELLQAAGIKAVPTGLAHGTITARLAHHDFEITTLRRDVATDGRRATVAFTDDFVEDAARRDFTINAMSCDSQGRLYDPFGGRDDLGAGRVRFVGEPRQRIREDYLRILRWFRFFARFGREPPDASALTACTAEAGGIARLSGERLHKELFATLALPNAVRALELMRQAGVLAQLLPTAVSLAPLPSWQRLGLGHDPVMALAAMLRAARAGERATDAVAKRLRLSRAEAQRLAALVRDPLPSLEAGLAIHRRDADAAGADAYRDRLALAAVLQQAEVSTLHELWHELDRSAPPPFPVDGVDVLARGVPAGPEVGRLLAQLRAWWRQHDFTPDREACLHRLAELVRALPSA